MHSVYIYIFINVINMNLRRNIFINHTVTHIHSVTLNNFKKNMVTLKSVSSRSPHIPLYIIYSCSSNGTSNHDHIVDAYNVSFWMSFIQHTNNIMMLQMQTLAIPDYPLGRFWYCLKFKSDTLRYQNMQNITEAQLNLLSVWLSVNSSALP